MPKVRIQYRDGNIFEIALASAKLFREETVVVVIGRRDEDAQSDERLAIIPLDAVAIVQIVD